MIFLKLSLAYSIPVFLARVGVLQGCAAYNSLSGLLFSPKKIFSYALAIVTIVLALASLFDWNWRYATGIIQGAQQAEFSFLGTALAFVFTVIVAWLINRSRFPVTPKNIEGLDALRDRTFFQAFKQRFGRRS
jgi:uncharacterized membrane protein